MTVTGLLAAFVLAALLTALLTRALLGWLGARMLDHPNARSMHTQPTPRGGGVVFAGVVLAVHATLLWRTDIPIVGATWWLAGAAFAVLGWLDDRHSRSASLRLSLQSLIASAYVITFLAPPIQLTPLWGNLLVGGMAIVSMVWLVNATNFIDGADGYCATQSMMQAVAGAIILLALGEHSAAFLALALGGSCAGFLRWNWPRAQVFMGDSGSYFLGFEFTALALYATSKGASAWTWLILAAPIVGDASLTLLRRMVKGARLTEAHRTHAYQQLLLTGWTPRQLLGALIASNVVIWWPLAALAETRVLPPPSAALIAYALAGIMWHFATRRTARI